MCWSIHFSFVSCPGKVSMKSFLGSLALRTAKFSIDLSCRRRRVRTALMCPSNGSNWRGVSFRFLNNSPSFSNSALALASALPRLPTLALVFLYCFLSSVKRISASSGSGPTLVSSSSSSSLRSVSDSSEGTSIPGLTGISSSLVSR